MFSLFFFCDVRLLGLRITSQCNHNEINFASISNLTFLFQFSPVKRFLCRRVVCFVIKSNFAHLCFDNISAPNRAMPSSIFSAQMTERTKWCDNKRNMATQLQIYKQTTQLRQTINSLRLLFLCCVEHIKLKSLEKRWIFKLKSTTKCRSIAFSHWFISEMSEFQQRFNFSYIGMSGFNLFARDSRNSASNFIR